MQPPLTFESLLLNDMVLYTYDFSSEPSLTVQIAKIAYTDKLLVSDVYSSTGAMFDTNITTMQLDPKATIIDKVSSIEDAKLRYPEYFI